MKVPKFQALKSVVAILTVAAALLLATAALAQDNSSPPSPGAPTALVAVSPPADFSLDPFFVSLQAGGHVDAAILDKACSGFVPTMPSVAFDYQGKGDQLRAFFYSDGDPVLVLQKPDGSFLCNDNTNPQLLDPTVTVAAPAKGRYNIWVGSRRENDLIPGVIVFTQKPAVDLGTFSLGSLIRRPSLPALLPSRERVAAAVRRLVDARIGAKAVALPPDGTPLTATVTAEGILPAIELTTGDRLCNGLVSLKPDFVFSVPDGTDAVSAVFEGSADTALLVRGPDDSVSCADDSADAANLNPSIVLDKPAPGDYLVWVGRINPSQPVTGTLTVAAGSDLQPKALARP
jgi:hypothetical protein